MSFNINAKKATKISLLNFSSAAMRAFHMSWLAFFVCFFAWFACAPLMPVIAGEFDLTKDQIANINIAAVAITILVRLIVGPLCDKYGPRKTYTALLIIGSIPVFGVAAANSYESFLFFRLLIGEDTTAPVKPQSRNSLSDKIRLAAKRPTALTPVNHRPIAAEQLAPVVANAHAG